MTGNSFNDILQTLEELVGPDAVHLVQQVVSRSALVGGTIGADIRVEVPSAAGLLANERGHRHGRSGITASVRLRDPRSGESRPESTEFGPLPTIQRWSEEARAVHGKLLQERISRLCNHVILALLPEAREESRKRKEKEEQDRLEKEEVAPAPASPTQNISSIEIEQSPIGAATTSETVVAGNEIVPNQDISNDGIAESVDEDKDMLDIRVPANQEQTAANEELLSDAPMPVVAEINPEPVVAAVPGSSLPEPERVTVMINGNAVDITDTGIDPTFLEALPDDMREEVLNQHFRERSTQAEQPAESQISPEFLDALPLEIRAEILEQERAERSRRLQSTAGREGANSGPVAGPADIDPASFIASLDPQLRQVVLLDQDDVFLQSLPSHMIAEAGAYREGTQHVHHPRRDATATNRASAVPQSGRPSASREAIQLLDRSGIATLVRLLFFPQLHRKNTLHKVLVNLCENSKSRSDLINLLLSILQDGTGELAMVDKSFSQLSFRSVKTVPQIGSKSAAKQKEIPIYSAISNEASPDLIAQRCLDALTYIIGSNVAAPLFFLTEHEAPANLKRTVSRKGKGKEKQAVQSHYPIVLLLGLLDRQSLLKTPAIMDAVAGLLDMVTRSLVNLKVEKVSSDQSDAISTSVEVAQTAPSAVGQSAGQSNNVAGKHRRACIFCRSNVSNRSGRCDCSNQ